MMRNLNDAPLAWWRISGAVLRLAESRHVTHRRSVPLQSGRYVTAATTTNTCAIAGCLPPAVYRPAFETGREHARNSAQDDFLFPRLHDFSSAAREYHAVPRPKINARTTAGRSDRRGSLSGKREESGRKLNGTAVDRNSEPRCRSRSRRRARKVSESDGVVHLRVPSRECHVVGLTCRLNICTRVPELCFDVANVVCYDLTSIGRSARLARRRWCSLRRLFGAAYGDYDIRYPRSFAPTRCRGRPAFFAGSVVTNLAVVQYSVVLIMSDVR